jgi:hypothetical protein
MISTILVLLAYSQLKNKQAGVAPTELRANPSASYQNSGEQHALRPAVKGVRSNQASSSDLYV